MTIDTQTIAAITGLVTAITTPIILYIQYLQKKQSTAQGVKIDAQAVKVDAVQALGEQTHILVNSNMGTSLLTTSNLAQRVADLTQKPEDAAVATDTRLKYDEHMAKQAVVDKQSESGNTTKTKDT